MKNLSAVPDFHWSQWKSPGVLSVMADGVTHVILVFLSPTWVTPGIAIPELLHLDFVFHALFETDFPYRGLSNS